MGKVRLSRFSSINQLAEEKALARLDAANTKMQRFLAPDSLMRFLQTL